MPVPVPVPWQFIRPHALPEDDKERPMRTMPFRQLPTAIRSGTGREALMRGTPYAERAEIEAYVKLGCPRCPNDRVTAMGGGAQGCSYLCAVCGMRFKVQWSVLSRMLRRCPGQHHPFEPNPDAPAICIRDLTGVENHHPEHRT